MAVKDKSTINSEAVAFINDNAVSDVTPADVRVRIQDLADSSYNRVDDPPGPQLVIGDTSAGDATITISHTHAGVMTYKNSGINLLNLVCGPGLTFEGGGTTVTSNANGDCLSIQREGSVLYFVR